ncbi:MAG: cupredoxin domain-containing protein [Candidatus Omnitrophica bacterium]|nr:cupredoxin domain-containing protein [Candidatus Omnitrophota bacterium]
MKKIMKCGLLLVLFFGISVPLAYAAHEHSATTITQQTTSDSSICPVTREQFKPTAQSPSYKYKGKTYQFCCSGCVNPFKKNPEKYISQIKEFKVVSKKYAFVPVEIKVKQNNIVKINLTSEDVPHGLAIKEYGINVSVKKGEIKKIEFLADKKGTFTFYCSVFCGMGHSKMQGKLIVE